MLLNIADIKVIYTICYVALPPIMVPLNIGDIPDQLPPLDDYSTTVPFNTNFPGLLDHPSLSAGLFLLCI